MLKGLILVQPKVHRDQRGFFLESFQEARYKELGIEVKFCQDNHSFSKRGVVRGMHFQKGQGKLVYCPVGEILDVAVDMRKDSPTLGKWEGVILNETNHHQLFIPDGFAHGFCVLSEYAHVFYKVTTFFDAKLEEGFFYNDKAVGIDWPIKEVILSQRDQNAKAFSEVIV